MCAGLKSCATTVRYSPHVQIWKLLAEILHLGNIVHPDIRTIQMMGEIILMVVFRVVKAGETHNLRHDLPAEDFGLVELIDIRLRDALLLIVGKKDGRPILGAFVGSLPV